MSGALVIILRQRFLPFRRDTGIRAAVLRISMNNKHLAHHHGKNINTIAIFLFSLVISAILSALIIIYSIRSEQNRFEEIALFYGSYFSQRIATTLNSLSNNLRPLYTMLLLHNGGTEHFERVAENIFLSTPDIININLAKDGIITDVYPLERNRSALGHNLLESDARKQEARLARDSRRTTLAGPFELVQGGTGLAFRQPIYLPSAENPQQDRFWGFAIITYRFPDVLLKKMDFNLPALDVLATRGFAWSLWRADPVTGEPAILLQSSSPITGEAQHYDVDLPNATWHFDICPVNGWLDANTTFSHIYFSIPLCLLFSVATMQFSMLLNRKNEILLQSKMDTLTDLYNKKAFWNLLEPALKTYLQKDRSSDPARLFLCVFDLNNFKIINDTYGHITGDRILVEFARRLSQELTCKEFASRFGGDEFVAVVYCATDIPRKLARLKQLLEGPYVVDEKIVDISVSIGAISPENDMLREKQRHLTLGEFFLEKVDMAMYSEKNMFHSQSDAINT